ncbi:uncharacterized protein LOC122393718, partial [Amphibalanus amphitrite]|uniref:uncharacterized protein LOC122393718 n=1 Tax=Amphibalanus amphitrite TaxID=1232801 RepID=UPI001C90D36F
VSGAYPEQHYDLVGLTAVPDPQSTPSQSMLAALITTSLFLFIVLVAGTIFFCKHRRKLASLMVTSAADKRGEVSRALYDDLSRRPHHGAPTGLRSGGPHIEMVAVKSGRLPPRLLPGVPVDAGSGTLFFYPPAPSLSEEGSERLSNMYEEIPYYGRPAPSVSNYSDSDEDAISHPSGDPEPEPEPGGVSGGRPEPRYVCSVPPAATGSRRRSARPRHHPALRRKDPYYYSDILERHEPGRAEGVDVAAVAYRGPRDQRGPLASRLAPDPLPDLYGGRSGASRAQANKLSSFRPGGSTDHTGADSEVYVNSSGRLRAGYGGSGRSRRTHDT